MGNKRRNAIPKEDFEAGCDFLLECEHDPLTFVELAFPWGEPGTPLADEEGPFEWQREVLEYLRDNGANRDIATKIAVASGNGIGKSALVAWIIIWAFSTAGDTRGVVTANTQNQLTSKTWAELNKWYSMFICKDFFALNGLRLHSYDKGDENTWRVDAIPWSKEHPESMAGLHNKGKREFIIFDEASAIDKSIWDAMEGAMADADTEKLWIAFGNPTRRDGEFYECFHKNRDFWWHKQVNSETVPSVSKSQLEEWRAKHEIDSDWYRVHVLGKFPVSNEAQLIPTQLVEAAQTRVYKPNSFPFAPCIIGVDMSWTGKDKVVISYRKGYEGKILKAIAYNDDDGAVAQVIAMYEDELKADGVFIDQGGGSGVYSFGKMWGREWQLVHFGSASNRADSLNKRAQMYMDLKDWLKEGGSLDPKDAELADDLCAPELVANDKGLIQLERKEILKKRIGHSTDYGDSFAITFAYPVQRKAERHIEQNRPRKRYNPLAGM